MGREKIEVFGGNGCVEFSSIKRDFANCKHNESRSAVDTEGGSEGVLGVRPHFTGGSPGGGRRGGGYVAGNA